MGGAATRPLLAPLLTGARARTPHVQRDGGRVPRRALSWAARHSGRAASAGRGVSRAPLRLIAAAAVRIRAARWQAAAPRALASKQALDTCSTASSKHREQSTATIDAMPRGDEGQMNDGGK